MQIRRVRSRSGEQLVAHVRTPAEPTIYFSRRLVPEQAPPAQRRVGLPPPALGSFQFAHLAIQLPEHLVPEVQMEAPPELEPLAKPWRQIERSSLWVPSLVEEEDRWERANTGLLCVLTPETVLSGLSPVVLERLAWRALTSFSSRAVAAIAVQVALRCESSGLIPADLAAVQLLRLPRRASRLLAARVARGDRVFDPRFLRWVVAEAAAAEAAGAWRVELTLGFDDEVAARVFFPGLLGGRSPGSLSDVMTALWLLQGGFHDEPARLPDPLSETAVVGYHAACHPMRWLQLLDLGRRWWTVDRSAYALRHSKPTVDALLANVTATLGRPPLDLLAGALLLSAHLALRLTKDEPTVLDLDVAEPRRRGLDGVLDAFKSFADREMTISFEELGTELLRRAGPHQDLGLLRDSDLMVLRRKPFIRIAEHVHVTGLDQMAAATVEQLRLACGGGNANSTLGQMLEALCVSRLGDLGPGHAVIGSETIDSVVPRNESHCDAIVVYNQHWLLIEIGSQRPGIRELYGNRELLADRCRRYHQKLSQAENTRKFLGAIAKAASVPPPQSVTTLVVVAEPILPTDALLVELHRQEPNHQPRFLASIHELDELVDLAPAWSAPGLVQRWQALASTPSLSVHLSQIRRWYTPATQDSRFAAWRPILDNLAADRSGTAA